MPFVSANIFQPLIDVFSALIVFFHDTVGLPWGPAIIALTVVVRIFLIPLTIKQFRSMAALQQLAPEIKALQEKYKNDRQRLNQEMMKFYQENKVNPFGSCLPLLLQMPVFLALFFMLREDLKLDMCGGRQLDSYLERTNQKLGDVGCSELGGAASDAAQFLFIPDLTDKATGGVLIALLVMYVASQLISSVLMSVSADRNQRLILIALPFLFVPFILSFPSGLIVYWITTNIWTVGQQYFVRRHITHPAKAAAEAAGRPALAAAAAGGGSGGSGGGGDGGSAPKKAPPPPPRKKKKRSGRRR